MAESRLDSLFPEDRVPWFIDVSNPTEDGWMIVATKSEGSRSFQSCDDGVSGPSGLTTSNLLHDPFLASDSRVVTVPKMMRWTSELPTWETTRLGD